MALPLKLSWEMAQNRWARDLDPLIKNPVNALSLLENIKLTSGVNVINHLLAQKQQGWLVTDIDQAVTIYRSQAFNDKTLTLVASGPATVTIGVF